MEWRGGTEGGESTASLLDGGVPSPLSPLPSLSRPLVCAPVPRDDRVFPLRPVVFKLTESNDEKVWNLKKLASIQQVRARLLRPPS